MHTETTSDNGEEPPSSSTLKLLKEFHSRAADFGATLRILIGTTGVGN